MQPLYVQVCINVSDPKTTNTVVSAFYQTVRHLKKVPFTRHIKKASICSYPAHETDTPHGMVVTPCIIISWNQFQAEFLIYDSYLFDLSEKLSPTTDHAQVS